MKKISFKWCRRCTNLFNQSFKLGWVYLLCFSLVSYPTPLRSQSVQDPQNPQPSSFVESAHGILDGVKGGVNAYMQGRQQQNALLQGMLLQQALLPRHERNRPSFPQCPMLPVVSNKIQDNVCQDTIATSGVVSQQGLSQIQAKIIESEQRAAIALQNANAFDKELLISKPKGNVSPDPRIPCVPSRSNGIQCAAESIEFRSCEINQILKTLGEQKAIIVKANERFRDEQIALIQQLENDNFLINGKPISGRGEVQERLRKQIQTTLNNSACGALLDDTAMNGGTGFRQIESSIFDGDQSGSSLIGATTDFEKNEGKIRRDLQIQLSEMRQFAQENGIEALLSDQNGEAFGDISNQSNMFASVSSAAQNELRDFKRDYDRMAADLRRDVGYVVPPLDHNFAETLDVAVANPDVLFTQPAIESCATSSTDGIPASKFVDSLTYRQVRDIHTDTKLKDFKADVAEILASDLTFAEKITKIQAIEQGGMFSLILRKTFDGKPSSFKWTPSQLLGSLQSKCTEIISRTSKTISGAAGSSDARKIQRAKANLSKLKARSSTFLSQLTNAISEKVLNCNGTQRSARSCSKEAFSSGSPNFCVRHARECVADVRSCGQVIKDQVVNTQNRMDSIANTYNQNYQNFVNNQQAVLNNINAQLKGVQQTIQANFPGIAGIMQGGGFPAAQGGINPQTGESIGGLTIPLPPAVGNPEFGVILRGGGTAQDIVKAMTAIEKSITQQESLLADAVAAIQQTGAQQLEAIAASFQKEKEFWSQQAEACNGIAAKMRNELGRINNEIIAENQDFEQKRNQLCQNLANLQVRPGCGKRVGKLQKDAEEISHLLTPSEFAKIGAFADQCSDFDRDSEASEGPDLDTLCNQFGGDDAGREVAQFIFDSVEGQIDAHHMAHTLNPNNRGIASAASDFTAVLHNENGALKVKEVREELLTSSSGQLVLTTGDLRALTTTSSAEVSAEKAATHDSKSVFDSICSSDSKKVDRCNELTSLLNEQTDENGKVTKNEAAQAQYNELECTEVLVADIKGSSSNARGLASRALALMTPAKSEFQYAQGQRLGQQQSHVCQANQNRDRNFFSSFGETLQNLGNPNAFGLDAFHQ